MMNIRVVKIVFGSLLRVPCCGRVILPHQRIGKKIIWEENYYFSALDWWLYSSQELMPCCAVKWLCVLPNSSSTWLKNALQRLVQKEKNARWTEYFSISLKTWTSDHLWQDTASNHGELAVEQEDKERPADFQAIVSCKWKHCAHMVLRLVVRRWKFLPLNNWPWNIS